MKRDMELVRKILFALEENDTNDSIRNLEVKGYEFGVVAYHCAIMNEAGLLHYFKQNEYDGGISSFYVNSLSWQGHDFLDKIREDTVWNKTNKIIKEKGLPMVLDVIKEVSTAIITEMTSAAVKGIFKGMNS